MQHEKAHLGCAKCLGISTYSFLFLRASLLYWVTNMQKY